ncbi:MAG: response regulator transcription factor [Candidatus Gastranaerophilales bacterium]|nr:response regulator transcription factor [Candidatus Gastranaerophilales bacterium]
MDRIKVSVAEDCLLTRISLKHALSYSKNIKIIDDSPSALELIKNLKKENLPDIILMDLDLKGMNGIEATCYLKEKFPKIKVIILTAHSGKDFFNASISSGARGFLSKNIEQKELEHVIEAVYFGAFWFDSSVEILHRENFPKPKSNDLWHLYTKETADFALTAREMQVLKLLAQGKSNSEIAKEIIVSANTAKAHVGNILNKMHVADRTQAAVKAVKTHMI